MQVSRIIAEIDSQILKLQQAKALLSDSGLSPEVKLPSRRGRPKGSKNAVSKTAAKTALKLDAPAKSKRKLSADGRKRIAEAMKKRWAERKKQTAKP